MLESILRTLGERVRLTIRKECGDTARSRFDTSDIVQESLIQIWLNMSQADINRLIHCKSWLRKIALGQRAKLKRKHLAKKRSVYMEALLDSGSLAGSSVADNAQISEQVELVLSEIDNLKPLDQRIVTRYVFEDDSFLVIAFDLGKDAQFVRRRYRRAIKNMTGNLKNQGVMVDER